MAVICVDLSHYQSGFNMQQFKDSGGLGVICKATEGTSYSDDDYPTFRKQALAAGLAFASYHFLRPGNMISQANFFLGYAQPENGERVVADWEDASVSVNDVVTFLQEIQRQNSSLQLTVYGSNVLEENVGTNQWLTDNTSLWTAAYNNSTSPGSYPTQVWANWSLWQYTDTGTVPGYNGGIDCNKFNGPDANFLAWIGPAGVAPVPPKPSVTTLTISSDTVVNLKIIAGNNVTLV
jgi:GH25 family lysozyme M1 (1,4-beta-N-acetylmuramidase)